MIFPPNPLPPETELQSPRGQKTEVRSDRRLCRAEALDYMPVLRINDVVQEKLLGPGKNRDVVKARRIVCFWSVLRLGMTMTAAANKLGVSVPTVSLAVDEGERLACEENISLMKTLNHKI